MIIQENSHKEKEDRAEETKQHVHLAAVATAFLADLAAHLPADS